MVDDDDLSRLGIVRILEEEADLEVTACLNHGEAGADLFFHRSEVQDRRALCEVLRCPEQFQAPVPAPGDAEALFRHGVTERARFLRYFTEAKQERAVRR